eukprot:CAMPEP_0118648478 /NCGR_PEP_ID=MMETSP0785-20121206/9178_1 /TAXON_ID=91992 /ORGANISM="Bolidomonas pacifica, Strain CCMP 1866" /LENGTH=190 /DNA_ID=CAMNT_0006540675 /DNA_START=99 /DNA_END=668 /DNA_ORIENTATION=+
MSSSVMIASQAHTKIKNHALNHLHLSVQGCLIGRVKQDNQKEDHNKGDSVNVSTNASIGASIGASINVTDAIPVAHGNATIPIVEQALECLFQDEGEVLPPGQTIVGWYTASSHQTSTTVPPQTTQICNLISSNSPTPLIVLVVNNKNLTSTPPATVNPNPCNPYVAYLSDGRSDYNRTIEASKVNVVGE